MEEKKKGNPTILMKRYEIGPLLGQGNFAKVYSARHVVTGETFAIKVIHKEKVIRASSAMSEQIKREISVMRRVRHPNIVQLHEVMATKTKIYFAMEYVKGGELLAKVARGRLDEATARRYFQQLMAAVDFCHSRGVYHRDLKPENLLLDENSNLKVSDFGLSAIGDSCRTDGLLHTRCGTPAYVAPEVLSVRGYDGAKADIWSCGIILFVLLAGFLPFRDHNIVFMYQKIARGEFKCPPWFPYEVKKLLFRILDPCPTTRLTIAAILANPWVRNGFNKPAATESRHQLEDEAEVSKALGMPGTKQDLKCISLNAFDIISRAQGFDLSGLFEDRGQKRPQETSFTTKKSATEIVSKLEEIAMLEKRFKVRKTDGMVKLQGYKEGRKGQIAIDAEIFQVTPTFHMVEMKKAAGDTWEYQNFYDQELKPKLKDIVWTWQQGGDDQGQQSSPPPSSRPPLPPRPRAA